MHSRFTLSLITAIFIFLSEPTLSQEPITIGMDADMSGGAAIGGLAIKRGAKIALDEINSNGGILGRPLELVVKDHRGNPARGVKNIETFAKVDNLAAVLGGVHTPVALAELPTLHENRMIYLDPWAAGTPVVENGYAPNYVFRVSVRDSDAGQVLIERAKARGFNKVALVLERTGWGRSNEVSLKKAAQENDIEIVSINWINWRQKSYKSEFGEIIKSQPDALILVSNAPEGAVVALNNIEAGANYPIISHWGIAGGSFVNDLGAQLLAVSDIEVLQTFHFQRKSENPKSIYLFEAYKRLFDSGATKTSIPAQVGIAQAYDLVHLLAVAIKKAGTIESSAVRTELEKIENHEGAVKFYNQPFTSSRHDALMHDDYFMATFNTKSELIPVNE